MLSKHNKPLPTIISDDQKRKESSSQPTVIKKPPHSVNTNRPPAPKLATKSKTPSHTTSASSSKTRPVTKPASNNFTSDFIHTKPKQQTLPNESSNFGFYDPSNMGATYDPAHLNMDTDEGSFFDIDNFNSDVDDTYSFPTNLETFEPFTNQNTSDNLNSSNYSNSTNFSNFNNQSQTPPGSSFNQRYHF